MLFLGIQSALQRGQDLQKIAEMGPSNDASSMSTEVDGERPQNVAVKIMAENGQALTASHVVGMVYTYIVSRTHISHMEFVFSSRHHHSRYASSPVQQTPRE